LFFSINAQQRDLTLEEVVMEARTTLGVKVHRGLQWIKDTEQFSYISEKDSQETLYRGSAEENLVASELSILALNNLLGSAGLGNQKKFPGINWLDESSFWIWRKDTLVLIDVANKSAKSVNWFSGKGIANRDVHAETFQVAFTHGNSLLIMMPGGIEQVVKRVDSTGSVVVGQDIHRREFGIRKGTFWSPDGSLLAFYEKDISPVKDYPYVDFATTPAVVKPEKYPMAGMANHVARVGVYDLSTNKTVYLQTGESEDQYLSNLAWSPDEKYILLAQINRGQNHLRMMKYSAETGEPVRLLFEEKDEAYVDPHVAPYFPGDNSSRFLWLSRRDGWNHLYLYNIDGDLQRQLTSGEWEITKLLGSNKKGEEVYFEA
ncbi:MAG: DPP IV N-terminal domain-containing protein, partial [Calditrichota bacterium]